MRKYQMYIGGKWCDASDGKTSQVLNPATEEAFAEVPSMTIAQEEIFGPVLCVIKYKGDEEAVRIANDSKRESE